MGSQISDSRHKSGGTGGCGFSLTSCNPDALTGSGPDKPSLTCAVRYGHMRYIGEFRYSPGTVTGCGSKVVVQTNRGIEIGEQVSLTCSGCGNSVSRQQISDYVKNSESPEFFQPKSGRILRQATPQDLIEVEKIREDSKEKLGRAKELAASLDMDMRLIACEHLLGGERIIFHFMSESRVDFRELVRDLAHEYHTRIEMHQVGARDEARLIADYEMCGRECCCKNFLKKLRPVTMRMAKLQKATLDPSKVSGRCGRLRCCLRYEYEGYDELNKKLPRIGARVRTEKGIGTVKDRQVLTQLITIVYDDRDLEEAIDAEQILERNLPKKPAPPPPAAGEAAGAADVPEPRSRPRRQPVVSPPASARGRREGPNRGGREDRNAGGTNGQPAQGELVQPNETEAAPEAEGSSSATTGPDGSKRGRRRGRRGRRRQRHPQADGSGGPNAGPPNGGRNEDGGPPASEGSNSAPP